jgi:hypothetical protein
MFRKKVQRSGFEGGGGGGSSAVVVAVKVAIFVVVVVPTEYSDSDCSSDPAVTEVTTPLPLA